MLRRRLNGWNREYYRFLGGGRYTTLSRQGFTVAELVAALVIIAVIVVVTLPVTIKKFKKVDYASQYMGYEFMRNISANVIPGFFKDEEEDEEADCAIKLSDGTCFTAPFKPTPVTKAECEQLVAEGYPIKECYAATNDYWAGAVKACKDMGSSLPSQEQLDQLAKDLYPGTEISSTLYEISYGTRDNDLAVSMGFTISPDELFLVWSSEEYSKYYAYFRHFNPTHTYRHANSRYNRHNQEAVCLSDGAPEEIDYTTLFCQKLEQTFNKYKSDCSVPVATVQAAVPGGNFKNLTPHIELANGLKLYIGSDYEDIEILSDAEEEDDRSGFLIYIDTDGNSGKGKLNDDVVPYYLLKSGKILPAETFAPSGEQLKVNVMYDVFTGSRREIKLLLTDSDYKTAACKTGYIKSVKYCGTTVQDDICKDVVNDCRMKIKEPIKIF